VEGSSFSLCPRLGNLVANFGLASADLASSPDDDGRAAGVIYAPAAAAPESLEFGSECESESESESKSEWSKMQPQELDLLAGRLL